MIWEITLSACIAFSTPVGMHTKDCKHIMVMQTDEPLSPQECIYYTSIGIQQIAILEPKLTVTSTYCGKKRLPA